MYNYIRNPAETVELGAEVVYALSCEEDSIEATRHYESCNLGVWDGQEGCQFCLYGPVDDMRGFLRRRLYGHEAWSFQNLGDAWYF